MNPQRVLRTVIFIIAVVGAALGVLCLSVWAHNVPRGRDVDLITGFNQQSRLLAPNQYALGIVLAVNYHEFRNNSSWWSIAYFGSLFLSALFSATAALVLKLECFPNKPSLKKDLAAALSTAAAVLITLSTVGNFQQKWEANRLAATATENLVYEVWKGGAGESRADIYSKIEEINQSRNDAIVGSLSSATKNKLQ